MSFKVVLINESQEVEPVPHLWEENGRLFWPRDKKTLRKFQSDGHSVPDKLTWISYNCIVKCEKIFVYGDASREADYYIENPTEDEGNTSMPAPIHVPSKSVARRIKPKNDETGNIVHYGQFEHLMPKQKINDKQLQRGICNSKNKPSASSISSEKQVEELVLKDRECKCTIIFKSNILPV